MKMITFAQQMSIKLWNSLEDKKFFQLLDEGANVLAGKIMKSFKQK